MKKARWLSSPTDLAIDRLMEGNFRYVSGAPLNRDRDQSRRSVTAAKQEPFAIILGCSDSRVSPEIIFDQGIGDLFIVRVAGNVVGTVELESIEFSVLHFHSAVILVLGHLNCSAVKAIIDGHVKDEGIESIAQLIQPAVDQAKKLPGNLLENAVKLNVELEVKRLQNNPVIAEAVKLGRVQVFGGYYDLESGRVELISRPVSKLKKRSDKASSLFPLNPS
jgi:carbonic anhydrase